ncbi:DUF805 domain-containing protein [Erythrobacter sp. THAF29]|uniref:DUF805 domain-containing protein n=1 Tax=Erythrobacter sp. THAF29 TaxID=2587851 RepID=UPI001268262E|nr:DUF805 domain-containing protein [Erythrobacter sp. THAF29]QFT78436.1 Inner membrane protein YhaI [Erythrobacter sp. THAF29]
MEWMLMPLRRYADFSGRSRRKEYWMFVLFQIIVLVFMAILVGITGGFDESGASTFGSIMLIICGIVYLGLFFIPGLAVTVRRFHDQDKSGWFILLQFIPYVGGLIVLVFMCLEGTRGPNRYGPDPKGVGDAETFA